jgi:hypothetical protein
VEGKGGNICKIRKGNKKEKIDLYLAFILVFDGNQKERLLFPISVLIEKRSTEEKKKKKK